MSRDRTCGSPDRRDRKGGTNAPARTERAGADDGRVRRRALGDDGRCHRRAAVLQRRDPRRHPACRRADVAPLWQPRRSGILLLTNDALTGGTMDVQQLESTARALVAEGKGILAADESDGTIKKRFDSIGIESTEANRQAYRDMLFTTDGAEEYISGVILFDETIRQRGLDGTPFPQVP